MNTIENILQLREFLGVYNTLTERCFSACVRQFNSHELDAEELKCTKQCIDKQMRVNKRLMNVFSELGPAMMKRQQDQQIQAQEAAIAAAQVAASVENPTTTAAIESDEKTRMATATCKPANVKAVDWRPDGRRGDQFRRTQFRMSEISQADGSCYFVQGGAKVLCSVFGPLQRFRMRKLDDAAVLRCHLYRSRYAGADRQKRKARADKETHQILEQVLGELILLENYPRTRIDIVFRVLEMDGNNIAVCLNAANFALIDAGITMRGLLAVLNCAYVNEQVVVDVCDQDDQDASGAVTIGSINGTSEASFIDLRGCFGREIFKQIMTTALDACSRLHDEFRKQMRVEVLRAHTEKPIGTSATDNQLDHQMAKLEIHEAGEQVKMEKFSLSEYDQPFEPVISDSEDESKNEDEEMEEELSELNRQV
ncbi:hypothetical protein M3Y94_00730300 [Aphelenchoides besseyi]|nr:hypothetical protein M3Y94_00730300 [Aphelenchoides besseyi]